MVMMKKAILLFCILLIICASLYAVDYKIGDEGPAGGIIFYDKGEYSDGWRYLEAAPADLWIVDGVPALDLTFDEYYADEYYQVFGYYRKDASSNNMYVNGKETLGNYSKAEELTGTGIGAGKKNTELLAKAMGDKTYYTMGAKKVVYAAKLCHDLVFNGFDDWFLPSKDELNLLYVNLCKNDLGDFDEDSYWSSSETDFSADYAWRQQFYGGGQQSYGTRDYAHRIRPIRAF